MKRSTMKKTIKDICDILRIHNVGTDNIQFHKYVKIDVMQVAKYFYGVGYRKLCSKNPANPKAR